MLKAVRKLLARIKHDVDLMRVFDDTYTFSIRQVQTYFIDNVLKVLESLQDLMMDVGVAYGIPGEEFKNSVSALDVCYDYVREKVLPIVADPDKIAVAKPLVFQISVALCGFLDRGVQHQLLASFQATKHYTKRHVFLTPRGEPGAPLSFLSHQPMNANRSRTNIRNPTGSQGTGSSPNRRTSGRPGLEPHSETSVPPSATTAVHESGVHGEEDEDEDDAILNVRSVRRPKTDIADKPDPTEQKEDKADGTFRVNQAYLAALRARQGNIKVIRRVVVPELPDLPDDQHDDGEGNDAALPVNGRRRLRFEPDDDDDETSQARDHVQTEKQSKALPADDSEFEFNPDHHPQVSVVKSAVAKNSPTKHRSRVPPAKKKHRAHFAPEHQKWIEDFLEEHKHYKKAPREKLVEDFRSEFSDFVSKNNITDKQITDKYDNVRRVWSSKEKN